MAINHRTARGVPIDMDRLRLVNEHEIAVGNMRVNARGDQLGPGGKIIKTRAQIMSEKNKLHHSPLADEDSVAEFIPTEEEYVVAEQATNLIQPTVDHDTPVVESAAAVDSGYVKPRGSFAESVAQSTEVKQELLDPSIVLGTKTTGVQRI